MLLTLVSSGRDAAELACALNRLEFRLSGAARPGTVRTRITDLAVRDGVHAERGVDFAALPLDALRDPVVIRASSAVIMIGEGAREEIRRWTEQLDDQKRSVTPSVIALRTGWNDGSMYPLALQHRGPFLSVDATTTRRLYAAILEIVEKDALRSNEGSVAILARDRLVRLEGDRLAQSTRACRRPPSGYPTRTPLPRMTRSRTAGTGGLR